MEIHKVKYMKVAQITPGRFHHFDLARQLHKRGILDKVYTGFPLWALDNHNEIKEIGVDRVCTYPWLQTPYMFYTKHLLKFERAKIIKSYWALKNLTALDSFVSRRPLTYDVLIAQSGCGLKSGRRLKQHGGIYVCDRGSSHILHQTNVLREEYDSRGLKYEAVSAAHIQRELEEYEAADYITVPSNYARQTFVDYGVPSSKIKVVPYGVDLSRFYPVAQPQDDQLDILFVGGVTLRKGLPYLLEAFKSLKMPKKKLWLIGSIDWSMRKYFDENGVPEHVEILGHVEQSRLPEFMSRAHMMVLPSLEEGLALVQAQALACGCPVVSTYACGGEDLFRDGIEGFIVDAKDSDALARRITQLATDKKLRRDMANSAVEKVKTMGGWNRYGEIMVDFLNGLSFRNKRV